MNPPNVMFVSQLEEMGFSRTRSEKALNVTGNNSVTAAMDWLFDHQDDPDIDKSYIPKTIGTGASTGVDHTAEDSTAGTENTQSEGGEEESKETEECKSFKCDDCGKLLKTPDEAEIHAARTQHQNFSESSEEVKPLTEAQKSEQLKTLQERLTQRRLEKLEKDNQEKRDKEKSRRKTGQQLSEIKATQEYNESLRLVAEKKRDKIEEKLARQRVKEQIERDKLDRAEKFGKTAVGRARTIRPITDSDDHFPATGVLGGGHGMHPAKPAISALGRSRGDEGVYVGHDPVNPDACLSPGSTLTR